MKKFSKLEAKLFDILKVIIYISVKCSLIRHLSTIEFDWSVLWKITKRVLNQEIFHHFIEDSFPFHFEDDIQDINYKVVLSKQSWF